MHAEAAATAVEPRARCPRQMVEDGVTGVLWGGALIRTVADGGSIIGGLGLRYSGRAAAMPGMKLPNGRKARYASGRRERFTRRSGRGVSLPLSWGGHGGSVSTQVVAYRQTGTLGDPVTGPDAGVLG